MICFLFHFFKPDDKKEYSKFLPLELNRKIVTTNINGITDKDLIGATALSQDEFDYIVDEFELEKRTILIMQVEILTRYFSQNI